MKKNKNRNVFNSFNIYYRYYKSTGFYSFILGNILKIFVVISLVVTLVLILNIFFINISEIPQWIISNFSTKIVLFFFLTTETFFGFVPPDFFILWVGDLPNSYLMVGVLGVISYIGGLNAYMLGKLVKLIPTVQQRMEKFYAKHITGIKKWGGVFILISALFPLPYATICSVAGLMKFPFQRLLIFGIARIFRFYLYAVVIFGVI